MRKKYLLSGALLLGALGIVGCAATDDDTGVAPEETPENVEEVEETEREETSESSVNNPADTANYTGDVEAQYTTSINQELIDQHEEIYQEIRANFENETYILEDPLVVQDPYDRAPLTALVLFETEEPMEITVSVAGQTEDTTINHTYEGYETEHEVPVLGLYPDFENQVTLSAEAEDGGVTETQLSITTEAMPEDLLDFTLNTSEPERMAEGLTFLTPSRSYPVGVDSNGDVRWYASVRVGHHLKRLDNGLLMMSTYEDDNENTDYLNEADMLGKVQQSIKINMENILNSNPLHHDTIILSNGNYLALLHDGSSNYVEDEIAELDRETGEVVRRLNLKDVFPTVVYEEYDGPNSEIGDWAHINAIWELENEDAILLSIRQQDAIMKLTYPDGEIEWILSYPQEWHEDIDDYVLVSEDDELKYPAGQHAMMEMPDQDGNNDTLDIMLFDNNRIIIRGDEEVNEEYSRAVQYRINEENHTVEEIWSYGEEREADFYSDIVSDADYLAESNSVLIHSGRTYDEQTDAYYSITTEVTKDEATDVIYEIHYGPFGTGETPSNVHMYRAERFPLYADTQ